MLQQGELKNLLVNNVRTLFYHSIRIAYEIEPQHYVKNSTNLNSNVLRWNSQQIFDLLKMKDSKQNLHFAH